MMITTIWVILGTLLLVAEMLSGTFVLLFIALGTFCSALASSLGVDSITLQILTCGIVSTLGFWLLKKPLQKKMLKTASHQIDLGKSVTVEQAIPPRSQTRISYQGTTWDAQNIGETSLTAGDTAAIVGVDGNILLIKKITE